MLLKENRVGSDRVFESSSKEVGLQAGGTTVPFLRFFFNPFSSFRVPLLHELYTRPEAIHGSQHLCRADTYPYP